MICQQTCATIGRCTCGQEAARIAQRANQKETKANNGQQAIRIKVKKA